MVLGLRNKKLWMGLVIAVLCLAMSVLFPRRNTFQDFMVHGMFFVGLPLVFVKFFLKERLADFGFGWGNIGKGSIWMVSGIIFIAGMIFAAFRYLGISEVVSVPMNIRQDFFSLMKYLFLIGWYLFLFECFFRGFLMTLFGRLFGFGWGNVFQSITFSLFVILKSGQFPVFGLIFIPLFIAGISGFIVTQSRSVLYSFFFSYISVILVVVSFVVFA